MGALIKGPEFYAYTYGEPGSGTRTTGSRLEWRGHILFRDGRQVHTRINRRRHQKALLDLYEKINGLGSGHAL